MLTSLAFIFLCGLLLGSLFQKLRLPSLLGMLLTGILLGPQVLNLLNDSILIISDDLRQLALIIILTRAGLALDLSDLKAVGRPALLICFVPAGFEMIGVMVIAPLLLSISILEAAIMGAVVSAVSLAVVVPKMLQLMDEGYGVEKSIPQMIMAGASVDNALVLVMFAVFVGLVQGGEISAASMVQIPISIVLGLTLGLLLGGGAAVFFERMPVRDSTKVIILLSFCFLLMALEHFAKGVVSISGILAVMAMGAAIRRKNPLVAVRLSVKFSKLWIAAEILLFVLVGAMVDINYAVGAGLAALLVILGALLFRMLGVLICLLKTPLNLKERFFCMVAYCPKATMQAAIGALPLAMGLSCGPMVLTVAILAILITSPLGALGIDIMYKRILTKSANQCIEAEQRSC